MKNQNLINKINLVPNFTAEWNPQDEVLDICYKSILLPFLFEDYPIISRKTGYTILVSDLLKLDLKIMTAEEKNDEVFHDNYYAIIKAIDEKKVKVIVKILDQPKNSVELDTRKYLNSARDFVVGQTNYKLVSGPGSFSSTECLLKPNGFAMRPNIYDSFHFATEIEADTYGEVILAIDSIIHKIDSHIMAMVAN